MPKIAFSDVGLRSIKPPPTGQLDYWDDKLPAFGLRVSQGGSKTFILKRHNSRITIGRFGILSLADARTEAKRLLAEFTLGKVRPQSITYPQAVKLFIEEKKRSRRPNTYEGYEWLLNRFPYKGQISDITTDDITRSLRSFKSRSTYDHALVAARIFFNWAVQRRYVNDNPTFGLSPHGTPTRARTLSDGELKAVWKASGQLGQYGTIVRLLILTGQRRGEIAALQDGFFKDDLCTLPKGLTKNGREHTFPIGALAKSTLVTPLKESATGLLFPARGKQSALNGWSKNKISLDKLSGVSGWTLHDLRRTFATNMARLGTPIHITERLLNHVSGSHSGIVSVYQRHDYLPEMREALTRYENWLLSLVR